MHWFCWVLAGIMAYGSLGSVANVGKSRKPLTGGAAAVVVLVNGVIVGCLVAIASGVWR